MKIAILGYGVEGKSVEKYFKKYNPVVFDKIKPEGVPFMGLNGYDLVFRSPSIRIPKEYLDNLPDNWTSVTKYFFDKCPAPIIGVTGTKGKGTTASLIYEILNKLGFKVRLVGNIGTPAIDILDEIKPKEVVVYEMSSFQLWDIKKSPRVAVVLRIEPDHLDIHYNFNDYVLAKSNIVRYQEKDDFCIYYRDNRFSRKIGELAKNRLAYALSLDELSEEMRLKLNNILSNLSIEGEHNKENAVAAIMAVASFLRLPLEGFIEKFENELSEVMADFKGLPHRIEFIRELNGIKYYDDNYSSAFPAMDVALRAFEKYSVFLIAGGKDRGLDLNPIANRLKQASNLEKVFLIGETRLRLAELLPINKYTLCDNLEEAILAAKMEAENLAKKQGSSTVVLMSPGAASFDMFKNFLDRGKQFQKIVKGLK